MPPPRPPAKPAADRRTILLGRRTAAAGTRPADEAPAALPAPKAPAVIGPLFPRSSLDLAEKTWVERGLVTLCGRLGPGRPGFGGPAPETLLPSRELPPAETDDGAVWALAPRFASHLTRAHAGLVLEWCETREAAPMPGSVRPARWGFGRRPPTVGRGSG